MGKEIEPLLRCIRFNKYNLLAIITFVIIFIASMYVSPYFTIGDQIHYRKVYSSLSNYNFLDGFIFFKNSLSSSEPMSYLITWIGSNLLDDNKDLYISLFNAFMCFILVILLGKWKVGIPIIILVVFTNFYLYVLFFSAERMKYSMLFFLISIYNINKTRYFYFYVLLAVLSHIQIMILYLTIFSNHSFLNLKNSVLRYKINKSFLITIIIIIILIIIMQSQIIKKFYDYYASYGINNFYKTIIFFIMALYYSKNKSETIFLFIPLFIAIFFLGDMRINMFSYFIFLYYALRENNGYNLGIFVTSIYNLYKSIIYINNIFIYNYGGTL